VLYKLFSSSDDDAGRASKSFYKIELEK